MVDFSKVYPVQSIARSNCDPRIPLGYAGGQYAMGAEYRRLALAAVVAVVFYGATANTNYLQSCAKTLGELLLEPKACKVISMLLNLYKQLCNVHI